MSQRLDPNIDITTNSWGIVPLYSKLDDGASANDSDYVFETLSSGGEDNFEIGLSNPVLVPSLGTATVSIRTGWISEGISVLPTITVKLLEGGVQRGILAGQSIDSTWTTYTFNATSIGSFNNLTVYVYAQNSDAVGEATIEISWIKVDVPDGIAAASITRPSILATDLSRYNPSVSGTSSNSEFPITNLLNYLTEERWISSTTSANQSVIIDFGVAKSCNTLIIQNHNFDAVVNTGSIFLQAADNATFSSGLTDVATISPPDNGIYLSSFITTSKRYWRLFFNAVLNDCPYLGNLFLDNTLDFSGTYTWNYKNDDPTYDTVENISLNGAIRTSQNYKARLRSSFNFAMQTNQFKQQFLTFLTVIRNKLYPFYFINTDNVIRYVVLESDFNPIDVMRYNSNDIKNFNIKTQSTFDITDLVDTTEIMNILETNEIITTVS